MYAAIAQKIKVLITALNEAERDTATAALAKRIGQFLAALLKSIKAEKRSARKLSSQKRKKVALLIKKELSDIRKLRAFVRLAEKESSPEIIVAINELYTAVLRDISAQEAVLSEK